MIGNIWENPTLVWFFIGLFCVIGEFSLPGVVIVFFGIGAWFVALLTYFIPMGVFVQVTIFTVTSIVALATLRKRLYTPHQKKDTDITDDFIGKTAVVNTPLSKGNPGQVKFKGALWKAKTNSDILLKKEQYVKIVGQESITLLVEPVNE